MATVAELEKRLEAVEQQLAELRKQQAAPESNLEWARRIAEAVKDIPAEEIEAMHRYGREFRESQPLAAEESTGTTPLATNWIEEMAGIFENDPTFEKIVRYGREYRESLPCPEDEDS